MVRTLLIFVAGTLLAPSAAIAQDPPKPDMVEVGAIDDRLGRSAIEWSLDAEGAVELTTIACFGCAGLSQKHRSFRIPATDAVRLLATIPKTEIETALHAPCTLPHATSGWARAVDLNYRFGMSATYTGFFRTCTSPGLDALVVKLRRIGEELRALEPRAPTQP